MPSYIVKINKDDDLYVYWSTIVDAPLFLGNREEMKAYLSERSHQDGSQAASPARFDRADSTGTSAMNGFYAWDDGEFIVEQRGLVKREDLAELARLMAEQKPYPHILNPFEDGHIRGWGGQCQHCVAEEANA